MFTLWKYILIAIGQKPFRSALILLTICLSGSAIFASVSLSDTMIMTATNRWRSEYGYADIMVRATPVSPSRYFDPYKAEACEGYFAYTVKKLSQSAVISGDVFMLHGYTLDTFRLMLELPYLQALELHPFAGNKIIVSQKYAHASGVRVGDALTAVIQGNKHQFVVAAICPQAGPFAYEKETFSAIIPFEKMQSCLGHLGKADAMYIGLKDSSLKSRMILRLSDIYKGYSVSETYSVDHIRLQTNRSAVPFLFMSLLLCLMSVYVIYVVFQNIVTERMPQMGIFQAMGALRLATWAVILAEGAAYGMIGGIFSLGAGAMILSFLATHLTAAEYEASVSLAISPWHAGLALLACSVIGIAGGYLSLLKYRAVSIVSLIRQTAGGQTTSRGALPIFAFLMCLAAIAVLWLWRSPNGLAVYVCLVIVIFLSFLMASPFLYGKFAGFVKILAGSLAGFVKIVSLSIQNQRSFLIGATIVSVIVATTVMIQTIQYSDEEGSRIYFGRFQYDLELSSDGLTRGRANLMEQLPGVLDVCTNYYSGSIDVKGKSISIYRVHGVDTGKAPLFMDYAVKSSQSFPFEALENGKSILLTHTLGNIYGVGENDTVVLKIYGYDGIYREVPYKVIGFFDDEYTKLGRYALISQSNFAEDFKAREYSSLSIRTSNMDAASRAIESVCRDEQYTLTSVAGMQSEAKEESGLIISAMGWISSLSAFTGILGMLFILMLSLKTRNGELSIYYAMGFERGSIAKMLFAEMLLAGVAGVVSGCIIGAVISGIALPRLIDSLQIAMSIHFSPAIPLRASLFGLGICAASGAISLAGFMNTTIMGGLRCE